METTRNIVIEFKLTRERAMLFLTLLFLTWHPGFLGSETLTLTTYYPAPYGGYVTMLTTSNTYLARDTNNSGVSIGANTTDPTNTKLNVRGGVQWGINRGMLKEDPNGGGVIELGGTGTPYIDFSQTAVEDYSARLILTQAGRIRVDGVSPSGGGDIEVTGTMRNICTRTAFVVNSVHYCGGSSAASKFYTIVGYADNSDNDYGLNLVAFGGWFWNGVTISAPTSGHMMCCRFES